jgi:hypothetical protein
LNAEAVGIVRAIACVLVNAQTKHWALKRPDLNMVFCWEIAELASLQLIGV